MNRDDIRSLIRARMSEEFYRKSGAVLYGPAATLARGSCYIMGLNPGGDPADIETPIIDAVAASDGRSAYTHECWQRHCREPQPCSHLRHDGSTEPSALVRHQRNVIRLTAALRGTPTSLFSANAIFGRSTALRTLKDQTGYTAQQWWAACWPVHQVFLAVVRPRLIVTLGYGESSSAFGLLRATAGYPPHRRFSDDARAAWCFDATFNVQESDAIAATVVGVPHPSYFAPGPLLCERLTELCEGSLPA